jgi:hypothetical protein
LIILNYISTCLQACNVFESKANKIDILLHQILASLSTIFQFY